MIIREPLRKRRRVVKRVKRISVSFEIFRIICFHNIIDRILQKKEIIIQLLYRRLLYNASNLNVLFCKIAFQRIFFKKGTLLFAFGEKIVLIGEKETKQGVLRIFQIELYILNYILRLFSRGGLRFRLSVRGLQGGF